MQRFLSHKVILMVLLLGTFLDVGAQNLIIKSVSTKGNDVIIKYDLLDEDIDHKYTLRLYSSNDNFVQPLSEVEGDVGIDQSVGGNKQIVWHVKDELGEVFKGDVALELKGKLYIPFVTLNNFKDLKSVKRTRPYNVTWTAGRGNNVLTFDLYNKRKELVHTYTNIANVGEYQLAIPKDIKPGKDYTLRITDQKNNEDVVQTPEFTIKRKIPLVVKVGVIGILGSALAILAGQGSNSSSGSGEVPFLPDPILPNN